MALPLWPVNSMEKSVSDRLFDIIDIQLIHGMNFYTCQLVVKVYFRLNSVVLQRRLGGRTVKQMAMLTDTLFSNFPVDS